MNALEKVRKVREVGFGTKGMPYILTESEAAALLTDDEETQTECYNFACPKHTKTEPIGVCREGECGKLFPPPSRSEPSRQHSKAEIKALVLELEDLLNVHAEMRPGLDEVELACNKIAEFIGFNTDSILGKEGE